MATPNLTGYTDNQLRLIAGATGDPTAAKAPIETIRRAAMTHTQKNDPAEVTRPPGIGSQLFGALRTDISNNVQAVKDWDARMREASVAPEDSAPTSPSPATMVTGHTPGQNTYQTTPTTTPAAPVRPASPDELMDARVRSQAANSDLTGFRQMGTAAGLPMLDRVATNSRTAYSPAGGAGATPPAYEQRTMRQYMQDAWDFLRRSNTHDKITPEMLTSTANAMVTDENRKLVANDEAGKTFRELAKLEADAPGKAATTELTKQQAAMYPDNAKALIERTVAEAANYRALAAGGGGKGSKASASGAASADDIAKIIAAGVTSGNTDAASQGLTDLTLASHNAPVRRVLLPGEKGPEVYEGRIPADQAAQWDEYIRKIAAAESKIEETGAIGRFFGRDSSARAQIAAAQRDLLSNPAWRKLGNATPTTK